MAASVARRVRRTRRALSVVGRLAMLAVVLLVVPLVVLVRLLGSGLRSARPLLAATPRLHRHMFSSEVEIAILSGSVAVGLLAGAAIAVRNLEPGEAVAPIAAAAIVEPTATPEPTLIPRQELKPIEEVPVRTRFLPRLRIPQIRVEASLEPVGLTQQGAMDVPLDGQVVAWYSLGPFPDTPGNAILAGHVDWKGQAAVFSRLRDLGPGTPLYLDFDRGELQYVITWAEQYRAQAAPLQRVFENIPGSALTLITCGGTFDRQTRAYLDRIVVRAVRA